MPELATQKLTVKEDAFVEHYSVCLNGAEAARLAHYSERSARQIASRLLSKDYIKAAIEKRIAEKAISKETVLAILSDIATSSMRDFTSLDANGDPYVDLAKAADNNKLHLIKKLKRTKRTRTIGKMELVEEELAIELYDKQGAAVQIGKHFGLFKDVHEHTGKDGEPIAIEDARDQLQRLLAAKADRSRASGDHQPADPGSGASAAV